MKKQTLREYQAEFRALINLQLSQGVKRLLGVLPTGGGKTTIFADFIADMVEELLACLVVAHRQELIYQPHKRLKEFGVDAGIVMGSKDDRDQLATVASIQSLARRKLKQAPKYIIIDECHRAIGPSYQNLLKKYPEAVVLGFTATPVRTDGKFLDMAFDVLIQGPSVQQLTDWGYLVPALCYGPQEVDTSGVDVTKGDYDQQALYHLFDKPTLYSGTVEYWKKYAEGRPTIVFCQSVEHSRKVCLAFQDAGLRAVHVDGDTPDVLRKSFFYGLEHGDIDIVCNYGIAVEGVDVPPVSCIILDMATLSLSKFLQAVGRGLRTWEGKDDCIVIDHGGNIKRHGFPSDERVWQLTGKIKKPGVAPVKECPQCYLLVHASCPKCSDCGYDWPVKVEAPVEAEFELLVPAELLVDPAEMDIETLAKAAQYNGGMKWALQQLRIRTANQLKLELAGKDFASGAEYLATKKTIGQSIYLAFLLQYAKAKAYDQKWAYSQAKHY
jgi:DNA repair protein RadD